MKSRVSSTIDTNLLGRAIARPGMDTRTWVSLAVVTKVVVDPDEGVFADVTLMPGGQETTARVAQEYAGNGFGFYTPIEVDDEVLVEAPNGDADAGLILTRRLYSASDPPPQEAADNPEDVLLVVRSGKTIRIITKGAGDLVLQSEGSGVVKVGNENATEAPMKGDTYRAAEDALLTALGVLHTALGTFAGLCVTVPVTTPATALNTAINAFALTLQAFQNAGATYLATKVKVT